MARSIVIKVSQKGADRLWRGDGGGETEEEPRHGMF